ncbi:TPA: diguanylate cyclase [Vibrio vulnificus]
MYRETLLNAHRAVNQLLRKLALGMDRDRLNREIIELSEKVFGQRKSSILTLRADTKTLHLEHAPSLPMFYCEAIEGVAIGPNVGSCGAAAFHKRIIVVSDINTHENWAPYTGLTKLANLHACWSVPIIDSNERVLGTFAVYAHCPSEPHELELEALEIFASLYAVALEKYRLEEQLRFHATRDALTSCLNRRVLIAEAETKVIAFADEKQQITGCFFVDIDKFKYINDQYGHDVGDQVLIHVANALQDFFSTDSVVGRYGGDEFVCFKNFIDILGYQEFEKELKLKFSRLCYLEEFQVTASIGSDYRDGNSNLTTSEFIKRADSDMYVRKRRRKQHAGT